MVFIQAERRDRATRPFGAASSRATATGSGFVVDKDGTILTNAHVVEALERRDRQLRGGRRPDRGRRSRAATRQRPRGAQGRPEQGQEPDGRCRSATRRSAQVGDPVVAIGNPFGFTRTVTTGIVSALQRQIDAPNGFPISDVIQTDAVDQPRQLRRPAAGRATAG